MGYIKSLLGFLNLTLLVTGCAVMEPPPRQAASPGLDTSPIRVTEIERRLEAIERMLATGTLVELTKQVDELQRQAADLRGRTEILEYNSDGTTSRQRELYVDLDDRLRAIERRSAMEDGLQIDLPNTVPVDGPVQPVDSNDMAVPIGTDRQNYEAAFELLRQRRYREAGVAFQDFLSIFSQSQLKDNAQYWLAETYYVTGQFEQALTEFQVVLSNYPRSRKTPDAMLKVGYSNYELGRWADARTLLERILSEYPGSTAGRLAKQRLDRMTEEGN